jgi:hypothetical protein
MDDRLPELVERSGPREGCIHSLSYGEHVIGRGRGVSISLEGVDVSRRHARLEVDSEGIVVFDLGSKNGVFVDGRRIEGPTRVTHGGRLLVGDIALELSHPAAQVSRALADAGEATATRLQVADDTAVPGGSLLWPLVGVALFGGLAAALLLL